MGSACSSVEGALPTVVLQPGDAAPQTCRGEGILVYDGSTWKAGPSWGEGPENVTAFPDRLEASESCSNCPCGPKAADGLEQDWDTARAVQASATAVLSGCPPSTTCAETPVQMETCNDFRRYDVVDNSYHPRQAFPPAGVSTGTMRASDAHGRASCGQYEFLLELDLCYSGYEAVTVLGPLLAELLDLAVWPEVLAAMRSNGSGARGFAFPVLGAPACAADASQWRAFLYVPRVLDGGWLPDPTCLNASVRALQASSEVNSTCAALTAGTVSVQSEARLYSRPTECSVPCAQRPHPTSIPAGPMCSQSQRHRVEFTGAHSSVTADAATTAVLQAVRGGMWSTAAQLGHRARQAPGAPGAGVAGTVSVGRAANGAQMSVTEMMLLHRLGAVVPSGGCA